MTQPKNRTVEEQLADRILEAQLTAVLAETSMPWYDDADPDYSEAVQTFLAAAKEHGLVIGEGELDVERLTAVFAALPRCELSLPGDEHHAHQSDVPTIAAEYERVRR